MCGESARHADVAMRLLLKSINDLLPKDLNLLRDTDLDPLRTRDDFKKPFAGPFAEWQQKALLSKKELAPSPHEKK